MIFNEELTLLKEKIANAEDVDELNYIRTTNQKKYWWTSIFIAGLFYGLNGKVGKMIITWFVSVITLGIYALYIIYRSYKDETEFNNQMEYYILQRSKELKGKISSSELKLPESDVNWICQKYKNTIISVKHPLIHRHRKKKYFFHFPVFFYESDFFILTVLNVFSKNQSPYMGLNEFFSNKNIPTLSKSKKN